MDIGTISVRYAKALIAYAKDEGVEDTLFVEIEMLSRSFTSYPQLRKALENPILKAKDKQNLIIAAAVGKDEPSKAFVRFIDLVLDGRREFYLQFICMTYMTLYYQSKRIAVAKLITAVPISDKTKERIKKVASATIHARMKLQTLVDPSIEGGFIFDLNGYRLDASISTQLKRVKQQFIERNKRIV